MRGEGGEVRILPECNIASHGTDSISCILSAVVAFCCVMSWGGERNCWESKQVGK